MGSIYTDAYMQHLTISNYSKSYNGRVILTIPSLDLKHGIHWLKGINGSGKSTLFKSIAGIIPFEGEVKLNGIDIVRQAVEYRSHVAYSEAEPLFPGFLTQKDLISFTSKVRNASREQVESLIDIFQTREYMDQPISTYSSGMLKKTGLLLSFLGEPSLIILDEPFITIDQQSTDELMNLIKERHSSGTSFIFSTHMDSGLSAFNIDSIYKIDNGSVQQI